jgi:hypothetical protein
MCLIPFIQKITSQNGKFSRYFLDKIELKPTSFYAMLYSDSSQRLFANLNLFLYSEFFSLESSLLKLVFENENTLKFVINVYQSIIMQSNP